MMRVIFLTVEWEFIDKQAEEANIIYMVVDELETSVGSYV